MDEAHHLEGIADEAMSLQFPLQFVAMVDKIFHELSEEGLQGGHLAAPVLALITNMTPIRNRIIDVFDGLQQYLGNDDLVKEGYVIVPSDHLQALFFMAGTKNGIEAEFIEKAYVAALLFGLKPRVLLNLYFAIIFRETEFLRFCIG